MTNIADYGAFVELEPGIEGLIHVSEMSWTKKNVHPGKIVSTSQEVEVQVLEVDASKRRISLGLKQTLQNPWEAFAEKHPVGSVVEGEVKNKTEFGLFIGLDGDVDGMVHLSDLDWTRPGEQAIEDYKKGDQVRAKVLDVDIEKERIAIGVKQLASDPFAAKKVGEEGGEGELRKGSVVTCEVVEVKDGGIEVKIAGTDLTAFIKRNELARDRGDQRPERFSVGEKVDARITQFDRRARKVAVSIKALEVAEEKEAIAQYGSAEFGRVSRRHSRRRAQGARPEEVSPSSASRTEGPRGATPSGPFHVSRGAGRLRRRAERAFYVLMRDTGEPQLAPDEQPDCHPSGVRHDRGTAPGRLRAVDRPPGAGTRRAAEGRADELPRRCDGRLRSARLAHPPAHRKFASRGRTDL